MKQGTDLRALRQRILELKEVREEMQEVGRRLGRLYWEQETDTPLSPVSDEVCDSFDTALAIVEGDIEELEVDAKNLFRMEE